LRIIIVIGPKICVQVMHKISLSATDVHPPTFVLNAEAQRALPFELHVIALLGEREGRAAPKAGQGAASAQSL